MNFLIVGGFLGAGKTSLILQLAHYMVNTLGITKVAIIENEIGKVGIDDQVLKGAGLQVKGLFAGCVCCTMAGDLPDTVDQIIREENPDWIIMEPTGIAFPYSIKENLEKFFPFVCRSVVLADVQRWMKLLKAMSHLLPFQLSKSDVVLVNKCDLVDKETVEEVCASVKSFNSEVEVLKISTKDGLDEQTLRTILGEENIPNGK